MLDPFCPRCNSDFLGPDVEVALPPGPYGDAGEIELRATFEQGQAAREVVGALRATVCGRCGLVQLQASNAEFLAAAARRARGLPLCDEENDALARLRAHAGIGGRGARSYLGVKNLGERLVAAGLIKPAQLEEARKVLLVAGGDLGEHLVRLGYISEERLLRFCGPPGEPGT